MKKNLFRILVLTFGMLLTSCGSTSTELLVTFNSNGGSEVQSQVLEKGSKAIKPDDPTKDGYTFEKWTYKGAEWLFDEYDVIGNLALDANWKINRYSVKYQLNGGKNSNLNPTTYTVEDTKQLYRATKTGFVFDGWFDGDTKVESIGPGRTGDLVLAAHWSVEKHTVNIINSDPEKGTVSGAGTYTYGEAITLIATPNVGYKLDGWFENDKMVQNIEKYDIETTRDYNLTVKWDTVKYTITYHLNHGHNSSNPYLYTIEDEVIFTDPTRFGYTFAGWYHDDIKVTSIPKGSTGNYSVEARWTVNSFYVGAISEDTSKGTVTGDGYYDYGTQATLVAYPKTGYKLEGWYRNGYRLSLEDEMVITVNDEGLLYEARFEFETYSITYELDGGTNSGLNPLTYTMDDDDKQLYDAYKKGYVFTGWYNGDNKVTSIPKGSYGDLTLTAHYSLGSFTLNLVYDNDQGRCVVNGAGVYEYGEEVTLHVLSTPKVFAGYYSDENYENLISNLETYKFKMPPDDLSIYVRFMDSKGYQDLVNKTNGITPSFNSDSTKVTYGLYPQKHVNDYYLLEQLDKLDASAINAANGWYFLADKYYAKIDNTSTSYGKHFDDGISIESGMKYWFECKAIEWNVLSVDNGKYNLYSSVLLDSRRFDYSTALYDGSEIRTWLNNDFYNAAFSLNNAYIQAVDFTNNDNVSLADFYTLNNTSYGFYYTNSAIPERVCVATDWAKAHDAYVTNLPGIIDRGEYWSRSAAPNVNEVYYVSYEGAIRHTPGRTSNLSVRPCLSLNLA